MRSIGVDRQVSGLVEGQVVRVEAGPVGGNGDGVVAGGHTAGCDCGAVVVEFGDQVGDVIEHPRLRMEAKLPAARYHDARHTYASTLLSAGISVAAVADYLGDTPAVLLSTYAHLMPADGDRAWSAVQAALAGGVSSRVTGVSPGG